MQRSVWSSVFNKPTKPLEPNGAGCLRHTDDIRWYSRVQEDVSPLVGVFQAVSTRTWRASRVAWSGSPGQVKRHTGSLVPLTAGRPVFSTATTTNSGRTSSCTRLYLQLQHMNIARTTPAKAAAASATIKQQNDSSIKTAISAEQSCSDSSSGNRSAQGLV